MRGLVRTSLKSSITGEPILDYIYHMTLKLIKKSHVWSKTSIFWHLLRNVIMDVIK